MLRHAVLIVLLVATAAGCATRTGECDKCRETRTLSRPIEPIHLNVEKLSPEHIARVQELVLKLQPFINDRDQKGTLPVLTFAEMESSLTPDEKAFLNTFRNLTGAEIGIKIPYQGIAQGSEELVKVYGQKIRSKGVEKELPPQFLAQPVYVA